MMHDAPLGSINPPGYVPRPLQDLDSEGRVVITDHGAFVLFNVYAHTIGRDTSVERPTRKLRFLQVRVLQSANGLPITAQGGAAPFTPALWLQTL